MRDTFRAVWHMSRKRRIHELHPIICTADLLKRWRDPVNDEMAHDLLAVGCEGFTPTIDIDPYPGAPRQECFK